MDLKEKLELYLNANIPREDTYKKEAGAFLSNASYDEDNDEEYFDYECFAPDEDAKFNTFYEETPKRAKKLDIDEYISLYNTDNKFQTLLFRYIDNKNLTDPEVYNKAQVDRRVFSKIRSDIHYHPSKETIIKLSLSLNLNLDEALDLLKSANYYLPMNNRFDLIVRFCFLNNVFDVNTVNEYLYEHECKTLN